VRRFLILPLSLLVAALVPVVPAGAADAPVCTVHLPAAVSATSPYTAVWPTFTDCASYPDVVWAFSAASGPTNDYRGTVEVKNGVSQGAWRYRDSYPTGKYRVANPNLPPVPTDPPQNFTTTVVKFGSTISLKSSRVSDLKVPLKGVVSHYVASVNEMRRWAHRTVSISYRDCDTCEWKFLALDKTDAYGVFSLAAVSPTPRFYRAKVGETSTTWGRTSASVYN